MSDFKGNSKPKKCARCGELKLLKDFGHVKVPLYCTPCRRSYELEQRERYRQTHKVPDTKFCPKCRTTKDQTEFSRSRIRSDGLASQCKECVREYSQEWYKRNKEGVSLRTRRRQQLKRALHDTRDTLEASDEWSKIQEEFCHSCAYCGRNDVPLAQEHVEPLSLGGSVSWRNVVPACKSCNSSKQDRPLLVWLFLRTEKDAA